MKKLYLILVGSIFSLLTFAGNTVKVVEGEKGIKEAFASKVVASLKIDWSDAQYDHSKSMKEYWGDKYDYFVKECEDNFKKGFDEKASGLRLGKKGEPQYKLLIKVDNLDRYVNVMNIVPGFTVKFWGTIIIYTSEGKEIGKIEVDSMKGNRDFNIEDAFGKAFYILGKRVAQMK